MAGGPRSINLSVDDGQPLHGRVTAEGGTPREFHGWLGLLTVLGALLDHPRGGAEPSSPDGSPGGAGTRAS